MITWILLGGAFVSVVLVIYWLTEPPAKKVHQPRSKYNLPTSSSSEARRFERPLKNPGARVIKPTTQIVSRPPRRR
jgi:hypothetical protein